MVSIEEEGILITFGGYNGRYLNAIHVYKAGQMVFIIFGDGTHVKVQTCGTKAYFTSDQLSIKLLPTLALPIALTTLQPC